MSGRDSRFTQDVILDSINEGVFTVDAEWRITAFNRAAEQITGVTREEAAGKICRDVFHANICEKDCALGRTFQTGSPIVNGSAHIVNCRGERIPIRISTAILRDGEGKVIGGVETFQDLSRIEQLQKELERRYTFEDIIGRSPSMMKLFEILPAIAESASTVLVEGASGTGKELFARAIHNLSPRKNKAFVAVNCGALPDTLLESELFGYRKGAFTDARRDKAGRFLIAHGGTIFLDEIGDVSPALQVRLLRVLQERTIEPLGSEKPIKVDVRVVAAANRDLSELVKEGKFRQDLFYRVHVVKMKLPPLRRRREDVPLLVDHFVAKFNRLQGKRIAGVSPEAMAGLMEHDFPGNVRELENIVEQAFVLARGEIIETRDLPPELRPSEARKSPDFGHVSIKAMEKRLIEETLRRHEGNRRKAAQDLGVNPSTLYRKILALGIETPPADGRWKR